MANGKHDTSSVYTLFESFPPNRTVEIDSEQYTKFDEAMTTVVSAMELEDLFQVFAQSFRRFEKDMLEVAFEYAFEDVRPLEDTRFFSKVRHRFNVSILTILTSYKAYDDHCDRILKSLAGLPDILKFDRERRAQIFNSHLSYRICVRLRDYAQHRALPLGGFSVGGRGNFKHDSLERKVLIDTGYSVSPWLSVSKLKSSSQCKAGLREELNNLGYEKIDMAWLIRSFASAMYDRHAALRDVLRSEIEISGERINSAYEMFDDEENFEAKFLRLCNGCEDRPMKRHLAANVLKNFESCRSLNGAHRSYVTSQIVPESSTYSGQNGL